MRNRFAILTAAVLAAGILSGTPVQAGEEASAASEQEYPDGMPLTTEEEQAHIEETLNLRNNPDQEWTYDAAADAWILSVTPYVCYPEIPDAQGVSVCVPGAYVKGIDADGDGEPDLTGEAGAAKGSLVIDRDASVTGENGQVYTAAGAPVIFNTGTEGYSEQKNRTASAEYASLGYIHVVCGNRGKQSTVTAEDGTVCHTGAAPSGLADQKCAVRFVKYNILLGNLPGNADFFVSAGGAGGGSLAVMLAATAQSPDFFDYEIEAGAVCIYKIGEDFYYPGSDFDGEGRIITDGVWGCIACNSVTSLAEADMALAFESYLDKDYSFLTSFQKQFAGCLSEEYMDYINGKELTADEKKTGIDLDGDGKCGSVVNLTIDYAPDMYPETNGYGGTYLDLCLSQFRQDLQLLQENKESAETSGSLTDTEVYETYADLMEAYETDIEEMTAGDRFGYNQVYLYDPLNYIFEENEYNPVWTTLIMNAADGEIPLFSSLNISLAWMNAGVDTSLKWLWNDEQTPAGSFGISLPLCVDRMYGKHAEGAEGSGEPPAGEQTAEKAASLSLADILRLRFGETGQPVPAFDAFDGGGENGVFGSAGREERHWDIHVLNVLLSDPEDLFDYYNGGTGDAGNPDPGFDEALYPEDYTPASDGPEEYAMLEFDEFGNPVLEGAVPEYSETEFDDIY